MRLLNTRDLNFKEFLNDQQRPPYCILSHTWEGDETSYAKWLSVSPSYKDVRWQHVYSAGIVKILSFAQFALTQHDLEWIWVDTCCINKESSAELSEAINSMYKWYEGAAMCITYLSDVDITDSSIFDWKMQFQMSNWFYRGWTLQELLAPRQLDFVDKNWERLCSKVEAAVAISERTGIGLNVLQCQDSPNPLISAQSIATRMSWASRRMTTRKEDIAYCLLGIFKVNMSLLYGEGEQAFIRLQRKLVKRFHDETILLWRRPVDVLAMHTPIDIDELPRYTPMEPGLVVSGLLARDPSDFGHSNKQLVRDGHSNEQLVRDVSSPQIPIEVTNRGIAVKVYNKYLDDVRDGQRIVLPLNVSACWTVLGQERRSPLGITLIKHPTGFYRDLTQDIQHLSKSQNRLFPRLETVWSTVYLNDNIPDGWDISFEGYRVESSMQRIIRFTDQDLDDSSLIVSLSPDQLRMVFFSEFGRHSFDRIIAEAKFLARQGDVIDLSSEVVDYMTHHKNQNLSSRERETRILASRCPEYDPTFVPPRIRDTLKMLSDAHP